ncbi:hypothetical protein Tco_0699615 [Tanacetum coccineum]
MMPSTSQEEIPPPPPPPPSSQTPTQQTPHTVSTIKLPILKKGEYDIWAMKMEHYLAHTDYPIWEVIQNGNGPVSITTDTSGQIKVLPPRTAEEIVARERERKARTTLLMALPEDHLAKFYKMTDAKEMWDAIKSRFGGNDESVTFLIFVELPAKVNKARGIPVSTASPNEGLSLADPTHSEEDDSEIPPLEDIYQNTTDGYVHFFIFWMMRVHVWGGMWVLSNIRRDERGVVVRINARFCSYQMDVKKSAFPLWGKIDEDGYIKLQSLYTNETQKPLVKDEEASDVDVHLYRSLQRLYLSAVKNFFRRLSISWRGGSFLAMHRKETDLNGYFLLTEAVAVAAASCCGQVLIQIYFIPRQAHCLLLGTISYEMLNEKETIQVSVLGCYYWDDKSIGCIGSREIRESLRGVNDGTEALLIPTLFILWLDKVSTASANLVPLGKVSTALGEFRTHSLSNLQSHLQALISLFTKILLSSTMAVLDSCPKHNMVAYLEKTEGNVEFHEIIDFLKRSSIHHALTVSPVVSTTFVEQFWTSAKSKTINNVRHITAKVAGKAVSISEASIRSDLLFDDADGIDTLPNQAIFDAIQQMGSKSTSWDQVPTNIALAVLCKQLANVSVPLDHFPVHNLTSKVFSFMVKKGKHFSGKVTPLFATMLVQPTQGFRSGQEIQSLEGEDHKAQESKLSLEMVDEDKEIDEVRLSTEDVVSTDKEGVSTDFEKVSTDRPIVSTDGSKVSTDEQIEGTDEQREGTEEKVESTAGQIKGTEDQTKEEIATQASQTSTQTPTSMIFGDDET